MSDRAGSMPRIRGATMAAKFSGIYVLAVTNASRGDEAVMRGANRGRSASGGRCIEEALDALLERAEPKRLVEIVVRAHVLRALEPLGVTRDKDDRNADARAARRLHELLAGEQRHEHVGDDEVH